MQINQFDGDRVICVPQKLLANKPTADRLRDNAADRAWYTHTERW